MTDIFSNKSPANMMARQLAVAHQDFSALLTEMLRQTKPDVTVTSLIQRRLIAIERAMVGMTRGDIDPPEINYCADPKIVMPTVMAEDA